MTLRLLFVSTSVGPLGSGMGGGVELTINNLAHSLLQRGHQVQVVAPGGSQFSAAPIINIEGQLQVSAQHQSRGTPIEMPGDSVLGNMWAYVRQTQANFDLIINFAYDWLPLYLTQFLQTPVAHLISMGSLTDAMDQAICQAIAHSPQCIAVHTRSQAETFDFAEQCHILGNGFDLSL
ncbi:MAG: glycosyltransferase, partial [Cyanobacteria bacterium P01_A01_bin.17]